MEIGVVSRSFPEMSNAQAAEFMAANGLSSTELCFSHPDSNYWVYNGFSDISALSGNEAKRIVEEYRKNNVDVVAIGVFTSLTEPDDSLLKRNLDGFEQHMQIASQNGIRYLSTECGFIPGKRGIQADSYESDFGRLTGSIVWLVEKAEKYNVEIALEPCVLDVVPSAKRMRDLIFQVAQKAPDRLKVLLDPANLIANSSEKDMFEYLAPHLAYVHGKDRKVNDAYGRPLGDGDIDWPLFLALYDKYAGRAPFILEYVNAATVAQIRDRALEAEKAGRFLKNI